MRKGGGGGGWWWRGGWVANKINELALVEGNLPSSLVMVLLYSLMHTRQCVYAVFPPDKPCRLIHAKLHLL